MSDHWIQLDNIGLHILIGQGIIETCYRLTGVTVNAIPAWLTHYVIVIEEIISVHTPCIYGVVAIHQIYLIIVVSAYLNQVSTRFECPVTSMLAQ